MRKTFAILFLAVFLLGSGPLYALSETEIPTTMRSVINDVVKLIQDKKLDKHARDKTIETMIEPLFDFTMMAKLSVGKTVWNSMTPDQRREYVDLFTHKIKASYMSKLDLYSNEEIVLEAPQQVDHRIHLLSYIVSKGEKKEVLYKFYRSRTLGWVIYDVDVLGVSIIQSYRSQFAGVLKKDSIDELLNKLREPDDA